MSTATVAQARWAPAEGAHYLHAQKTSRVPRRYVFLDTESWRDQYPGEERQTWRLGVTATTKWRPGTATWSPLVAARHETPESLWEAVTAFARPDARTVVVAHNMGYDLRISQAFTVLPAMGWAVSRLTLSQRHISVDLTRDGQALALVDSHTVFNANLARVAAALGREKPPLPGPDAPVEELWARCEADVGVLGEAYMAVVDWLARDDLGGWARTGSGIGWHTLLRRHLAERVLVHGDQALRDLESTASYAGRAEAWRPGDWHGTTVTEWDYETAYLAVAESESLPARYHSHVVGRSLPAMVAATATESCLVHAQVRTEVPVLPWRDDFGVAWPVGEMEGWWWHWELAEAEAAGAKVTVLEAHRYTSSPWLASWAAWVRAVMADVTDGPARVRAMAAKHWSRAVIGRSAMRYSDWREEGPAYVPGVLYSRQLDVGTGRRGVMLELGDRRWEAWDELWWDQAVPQVLSAVMAHTRVRLWRAMVAAGLDDVIYCDTDCVLVGPAGHDRLRAATAAGQLPGLRQKSAHVDLEVMAPQAVEGSSYRRLAGVPRRAVRVGEHTYAAERWEGVAESLAGGHPGEVRVRVVHPELDLVDWRRRQTGERSSRPYRVEGAKREMPEAVVVRAAREAGPRATRPFVPGMRRNLR